MSFYFTARGFAKAVSYVLCPVKVHGDISSFPEDEAVILCANHLSYFDVVFLGTVCKRQIHFIAKKKYADKFILKALFKWLGSFGIDTEKPDILALRKCFGVLKNNGVLGIFPEGTRVRGGKVSNPMPGAIMIAHKSHTPIYYMRIKPRTKSGEFKLFCKTDLYIGELIDVSDLGLTDGKADQYKNASVKLMERIYSLGE